MKRLFDLGLIILSLPLLAPVFIVVFLVIKWNLGSPVFYSQVRPGLNAKPFRMIKFRSMTDETDDRGELLPDAERLTKFGRFLRSTSLDELPELLNVLKGDMSLVGPRPLLMEYVELYSEDQTRRHDVLPGITGWAQINGRNQIGWDDKFLLDVWYVENQSIWLDIKIIFLTLKKVILREGISAEGEATMSKFTGTKK